MVTIPQPPASDFTTKIDNPYMILRAGTSFIYESKEAGSTDVFTVTGKTKVVDGVTCVVVHDVAYKNGLKVEETDDWFAQDKDGNVWYFGEFSESFEPGNPTPTDTHGSWQAGINGAKAGIIMLANPKVGDEYAQEFAPGVAEDKAKVLALNARTDVGYGSFTDALKTADINPLDPSTEKKYYAKGVGNLLTTNADGEREELTKIIVRGGKSDDRLDGYAGGDDVYCYDGNDSARGGAGNDHLFGGNGADKLYGQAGHDDLTGGNGNDLLRGGVGADSFIFRSLKNGIRETDTVADYFKSQVDVIDIGGANKVSKTFLKNDVWHLQLKGDGDIVKLIGAVDSNLDGKILDDLFII